MDYTTREGFAERFAKRFGGVAAQALVMREWSGLSNNTYMLTFQAFPFPFHVDLRASIHAIGKWRVCY